MSTHAATPTAYPVPALSREAAREIVDAAVARYFAKVRARIPAFVDRHFTWSGAWRIHKRAIGADMLRAPLNTVLVAPALARDIAATGLSAAEKRLGPGSGLGAASGAWSERLKTWQPFLRTDTAREMDWLIFRDLLQLPYDEREVGHGKTGDRVLTRDALAEEILSDPRLMSALMPALERAAALHRNPKERAWLQHALRDFAEARTATTELAGLIYTLSMGAVLTHSLTPGLVTLAPALSQAAAAKIAAAQAGFGTGLGTLAQALTPVAPSTLLLIGTTGGLIVASAALTAIAGALTDPLQRMAGLQHRRLGALVDTMEHNLLYAEQKRFRVADAYLGRVLDMSDVLVAVWRHAP